MTNNQILNLRNGMLKSALLIQRHYFNPKALNENLLNIINSLEPYLDKNFIDFIFVYLLHNTNLDKEALQITIAEYPTEINNKIMSIYDELIQEGIEKGIQNTILNGFDKGYKIIDLVIISGLTEQKVLDILKTNRKGI